MASWRASQRRLHGRSPQSAPDEQTEAIAQAMEALPTGWGAPPRGWLLETLGFYGLDAVEEGLLIALVTGEPLLLVGRHGTAKTAICCRLGEVLGLAFHAYDAAKALFEDVVGFPDPSSLARGEVSYVPTPMSLWDKEFILVDELSRAQVQMQNKWLEVIRSHRLMGRELPSLQYVIAAMNPTDYLGAVPLDEALLSRFAVVVRMPEVSEMEGATALRVIAARSADDAPRLGAALSGAPGNGETITRARRRLRRQLKVATERLPAVEERFGSAVLTYVHEVSLHLTERGYAQDARRLGMIRRNLLVALALAADRRKRPKRDRPLSGPGPSGAKGSPDAWAGASPSPQEVSSLLGRTLGLSLSFAADGRPGPSAEMLGLIHGSAFEVAFDSRPDAQGAHPAVEGSLRAAGSRRMLLAYQQRLGQLPLEEHYRVVNQMLHKIEEAPPERLGAALGDLLKLGSLVRERFEAVPWEVTEHLMDGLAVHLGLINVAPGAILSICAIERVDPRFAGPARMARESVARAGLRERGELDAAHRIFRKLREQGEQ